MYFIDRYLNWFRNERIKIGLNNKSPKEYRTELSLALYFSPRKRPHFHALLLHRECRSGVARDHHEIHRKPEEFIAMLSSPA